MNSPDNLNLILNHLSKYNYITVVTPDFRASWYIRDALNPFASVRMVSPEFTYKQAFKALASDSFDSDVLILPDAYRNPETRFHTSMLMNLWKYKYNKGKVPRLVFMVRTNAYISDKEHVLHFLAQRTPKIIYDKHFDGALDMEDMKKKVLEYGDAYKGKLLVITPEPSFIEFPEKFDVRTEDEFFFDEETKEYDAIIDLCLRKITYASIGGGLRYINDIVGKDYLRDIEGAAITYDKPLYRLIDQETFDTFNVVINRHYVVPYVRILKEHQIDFTAVLPKPDGVFFDAETFPFSARYKEVIGPLSFHFLDKWRDRHGDSLSSVLFASMIDCLDHSILEYDENEEDLVYFQNHFLPFKGKDTLEVFMNLWNEFTQSQLDFHAWIDAASLNYSKMTEFYNVAKSLAKYLGVEMTLAKIKQEDLKRARAILTDFLEHAVFLEEHMSSIDYTLGSPISVTGRERATLYKNLLFENPGMNTIYPIYTQNSRIKNFVRA